MTLNVDVDYVAGATAPGYATIDSLRQWYLDAVERERRAMPQLYQYPMEEEDRWRSAGLDVARDYSAVVKMGWRITITPALRWDELIVLPSQATVVVGDLDHLKWRLFLQDQHREARRDVDAITRRLRRRLGVQ